MNKRTTKHRSILTILLLSIVFLLTGNSFAGILSVPYATHSDLANEINKLKASERAARLQAFDALQAQIKGISSPTTYAIGDTGPAGGKVFYVSIDGQHGLEASLSDQGNAAWDNGSNKTTNADRRGIQAGSINTQLIINNYGAGDYAAKLCADYMGGNYGDWYLPSLTELEMLLKQKDVVGGFNAYGYWSSSEVDGQEAWMGWSGGGGGNTLKSDILGVRAIRAF